MNITEIIQEQRTHEAYMEAIDAIMQRLQRTEEQIKKIETYVKVNEKALITEYMKMVVDAQINNTPVAFYDIWTIAKADEELFSKIKPTC